MGTAAGLVVCYCCGIIVTRIFTRMWLEVVGGGWRWLGVVGGGWLSGCVVEWLVWVDGSLWPINTNINKVMREVEVGLRFGSNGLVFLCWRLSSWLLGLL